MQIAKKNLWLEKQQQQMQTVLMKKKWSKFIKRSTFQNHKLRIGFKRGAEVKRREKKKKILPVTWDGRLRKARGIGDKVCRSGLQRIYSLRGRSCSVSKQRAKVRGGPALRHAALVLGGDSHKHDAPFAFLPLLKRELLPRAPATEV